MAMPPFWKVYRELDRTRQMLHAGIGRIYEPFIQRRHDRNRVKLLQVHAGALPLGQKVALFLIYQPRGVSPTIGLTCDHLAAKGYSPLVVSNGQLAPEDLAALTARAWRVVIRPNYGYDFGGYRDGVLWLRDQGIRPERLIVLNDSVWYPVWPNDTFLDRMEASTGDVVGAVIHGQQKRRSLSRTRPAFLESYFYLLNRLVLEGDAFRRFWDEYRVSSIKFNAVYRGERSFSGVLEQAGYSVHGLIDAETACAAIRLKDHDFLVKTLVYGAYTDPEFEAERDLLLLGDLQRDGWRDEALKHIEKVLRRRSSYASFPYASFHLHKVPFVKKSRLTFFGQEFGTVQIKMRTQLLLAIDAGDIPAPFPEVLAEMRAIETVPPRMAEGSDRAGTSQ